MIVALMASVILLTILSHASYAQLPPEILSDEGKIAADKLIQKISNSFKGRGNLSLAEAWKGAFTGEPILVHTPEEEPCYYIIPVISNNKVISNIGFSTKTGEWTWYTETYSFSKFPPVSIDEAEKVATAYLQRRGLEGSLGTPIVKTMPDKCLYWTFPLIVNGKAVTKVYVNFFSIEQVLTEESMERKATPLGDVGGGGGITTIAASISQAPAQTASHTIADVPHYYQVKNYYCGPASLEMVFDYYGPDILQYEIADAARTDISYFGTYTDDMRRATHFSDLSTSVGNDEPAYTCTGYTGRDLGYAAFEHWSENYWLNDLKTLIDENYPTVVLTWYDVSHSSGHSRVAIGYDDSMNEIIVHDPWYTQGPNVHFSYTTFQDLWSYSSYWGLFTHPWIVSVNVQAEVYIGSTFTVTGTVTYPCPSPYKTYYYPASFCQATIILPLGLSLAPGETAIKVLGTGSMSAGASTDVSWQVTAANAGSYAVTVSAEGRVSGSVNARGPYPAYSYTDRIGGDQISTTEVVLNPRAPIYIESNDNFTPVNGVTSGSGTENDPYIVEGWDINAENTHGIEIRNTTAHFIIRKCYVHDGWVSSKYGIYFENVINGFAGNNTLENNSHGIYFAFSDNNLLSNNLVENNLYGILLDSSDNNRICHNILINNTNQAHDNGTNYWDNGYPSGGNYWSDYAGLDNYWGENQNTPGGDGFGDTPYDIHMGTNQDHYPLMNPVVSRGVEVSILPSYQSGLPGILLTYTVTVTNTSNVVDNYVLSVGDNAGWGPSVSPEPLLVLPSASDNTTLSVTVPENVVPSTEDNITVTATSQMDNTVSDSGLCTAHVLSPKAEFSLITLYEVGLDLNLYLNQGSKLVVKFYTYENAFEDENVIENFSPPRHVEENKNARHPEGIGVKKVRLDLTTDNTENVIATVNTFVVNRGVLIGRISAIKGRWPFAEPPEKSALISEISGIKSQWPFAPS